MTSKPESFDFRLCKAMRLKKVGTCALARKVGIHPPVLSRLRSGATQPTFQTLRALALELDTSIDWMVGLTDELRSLGVPASSAGDQEIKS